MPVLRHTVRAPSRLVFQVWAKYNDEVPDVSASNQNTEMPCKNKLKLTLLKYLCLKSTEKLAKDHEFLFSILNALSVGNEEYYPKCYKVNGAKGLQKPLLWLQYHFTLKRLQFINTGSFIWGFSKSGKRNSVLSELIIYIGSQIKNTC